MAAVNLSFTQANDATYDVPVNWLSVGQIGSQIISNSWRSLSTTNAILIYDVAPTSATIKTTINMLNASAAESHGPFIGTSTGNGYQALIRTGDVRMFLCNGGVLGSQIGGNFSTTFAALDNVGMEYNPATGVITITRNGVLVTTFTNSTYTTGLRPGCCSRSTSIGISSVSVEDYSPAQTLTIATDLTPNASRTDTCTGFADGAATVSFAGVSVAVTVASGSFTWTVPMLSNGVNWPRLPSTGTTITLTQGEISANATGNITLPAGYNTLRVGDVDGGAPANFAGVVTDDIKFIGYHITMLETDTWYNPTLNGMRVYRNGDVESNEFLIDGVTLALPRTDVHFQQSAAGLLTLHNVTLTPAGVIVNAPGLTTAGLVVSGLVVRGLASNGL